MKKKAFNVLLILTVFLAMGFLAGTTWSGLRTDNASAKPPPPPKPERPKGFAPMHIASLLDGIELEEPKQRQVRDIEQELDTSLRFFREEFMGDMKRIRKDIDSKLIALLNDEQKVRFSENKRKWEERIRSGFGRRGPGKNNRREHGSRDNGGGSRDSNGWNELRDWRTKADINQDGDLSEEESQKFWDNYWETRGGRPAPSRGDWYWILRNFAEIDANNDGSLSVEECRAAKDNLSSRGPSRFGGRRSPSGPPPPHLRDVSNGIAPPPPPVGAFPDESADAPKKQ